MNKIKFALLLGFFLVQTNVFAQDEIVFTGNDMVIGKRVSILEDKTDQLSIKDVRTSNNFIKSSTETPNLQLSSSDFWLRFIIRNQSDQQHLLLSLLYPSLDVCEFYDVSGKKPVKIAISDNNNFNERKYNHQDFIFDVTIPKGASKAYYLRVRSSEQMVLPLILATPQKMAENFLTRDLLWGILTGILMVMVLYNLFVFFSTKDYGYLYYVLYTTFIGLTQLSLAGYTYRFIFQESPVLYNKGLVVFPALAGISAVLFIPAFLQTKEKTPRIHKLFPVVGFLYSLALFARLFNFDLISYRLIDISALAITVVTYMAAIKISLQGYRPARIFLVAWSMFFMGVILFVLRNLGVLPYNDFTNYTMQVGTAFEVTLLSLALADRINVFKREKELSQAQLLVAAQENERIVKEQNILLEAKVNERTVELSAANLELNQTLVNLKEAETQLVEAEKMASLGQLTAGIAHEINNPINFVTSNVNPLKRDVDVLFETIEKFEKMGLADEPVDQKQQKLEQYKEGIDLDYLKIEINHLLNGIHDGASRTAEIVKGLRIFSRLDEDDLKKADVNQGMDSTLIIVNNLLNNKIIVEKNYGNLPFIDCYPGKLNQVFLNILSNGIYAVAKKFGDKEGGKIIISTMNREDGISIKIEDNGIGMDDATKKKIFEPFFTTKDVGEGTGLGMSIAFNTIKRHEGEISVNSTPGIGTEFVLHLPLVILGTQLTE